jgi:CxxC motif-containing protein (DUF1111 family)
MALRLSANLSLAFAGLFFVTSVGAVSPGVELGKQLFERNWTAGNPSIGSDGLGPLFNARSCVACHHQGGVGGGGDSRFNAKTIGIETMSIVGGRVTDDVVAQMVSTFHPGFVQQGGRSSSTLPLAHFGGSPAFEEARASIMAQIPAKFSDKGGTVSAEETRRALSTPIMFQKSLGKYQMTLKARLFQRNTTSLFGSGLIDQVSDQEIENQVRRQSRHPEISGRPSTLKDGRFGKFGWRGNVASLVEFNDQACANEVGLETGRMPQPRDPMVPGYRNPRADISDQQIEAMTAFVAALPAPVRHMPSDSETRSQVERGEQVFASIGCAVCHVQDMGPAQGIYSDLLLHDMGYESFDLNHAEPYRVGATPVRLVSTTTSTQTQMDFNSTGYYGGSGSMTTGSSSTTGDQVDTRGDGINAIRGYTYNAPTRPAKSKVVDLGSTQAVQGFTTEDKTDDFTTIFRRGTRQTNRRTRSHTLTVKNVQTLVTVHYEPTNFNQEWRTPPLWGVRDSAPYMHDGRAETLLEAITLHEGESAGTRDRFLQLPLDDRHAVIAFLNTLVAPPGVPQPVF